MLCQETTYYKSVDFFHLGFIVLRVGMVYSLGGWGMGDTDGDYGPLRQHHDEPFFEDLSCDLQMVPGDSSTIVTESDRDDSFCRDTEDVETCTLSEDGYHSHHSPVPQTPIDKEVDLFPLNNQVK